jgi:hypothetical protein
MAKKILVNVTGRLTQIFIYFPLDEMAWLYRWFNKISGYVSNV